MIFLAGFSLCSVVVQECMMGYGSAIKVCLNSFFFFFCGPIPAGVRGLGKGEWIKGAGEKEQGTNRFFILLYFFTLRS